MKKFSHGDMTGGWFVGNFLPVAFRTADCEVAVKHYSQGDQEAKHFHKVATEITMVISGSVRMCDAEFHAGDIVVLEPGEATDFLALTDAVNVVVKVPGAKADKYLSLD